MTIVKTSGYVYLTSLLSTSRYFAVMSQRCHENKWSGLNFHNLPYISYPPDTLSCLACRSTSSHVILFDTDTELPSTHTHTHVFYVELSPLCLGLAYVVPRFLADSARMSVGVVWSRVRSRIGCLIYQQWSWLWLLILLRVWTP